MTGFCRREESGFTLVELLVAVAILMIGLVAVMQWFPLGTAGVETGRRQSTGVFLAEQKIEQIKAWGLSTAANQGFTTVIAGGTCFTSVAPPGPCASPVAMTRGRPWNWRSIHESPRPSAFIAPELTIVRGIILTDRLPCVRLILRTC